MIPDNIQANIMKYLNNGVSGSSQEQKPVVLPNRVSEVSFRYYPLTNNYKTDDGQYIVNAGMYRVDTTTQSTPRIIVWNVEQILEGEAYLVLTPPNINNFRPEMPMSSINRDEEGRFYGLFIYRNINDEFDSREYLILFNDFITDGIIQVNEAYNLNQYSETIEGNTYNFGGADKVYKKGGTYYLLWNNGSPTGYFIVGTLTINVGGTNDTKVYYYKYTDMGESGVCYPTMNIETDTIYGMFCYQTNNNYLKILYFSLPKDNETQILNTKLLYNKNEKAYFQLGAYLYNYNGNYVNVTTSKNTNNNYTFKYVFVRADGYIQELTIPATATTSETTANVNSTIYENYLFFRFYDNVNIDIKKFYRIKNNTIEEVQDLTDYTINFARIEFLRQFNLYYMFAFRPGNYAYLYKIIDVPTYGRFKLLKQKLLNSKLFRAFKFKRNK